MTMSMSVRMIMVILMIMVRFMRMRSLVMKVRHNGFAMDAAWHSFYSRPVPSSSLRKQSLCHAPNRSNQAIGLTQFNGGSFQQLELNRAGF